MTTTETSIPVRTRATGHPNRTCRPVIHPSRGPGPRLVVKYKPLPRPIKAMPPITNSRRSQSALGEGITCTPICSAPAMMTALAIVPNPGLSRRGIHKSKTMTLRTNVASPIDIGVCTVKP